MIECHHCKKAGHVRYCCIALKTEVKMGGEVKEVATEEDRVAFCMQLQAMEFMAEQERLRVRKYEKRKAQRARGISSKLR